MDIQAFLILVIGAFFMAIYNMAIKLTDNKIVHFAGMGLVFAIIGLAFVPFVPVPEPETWIFILIACVLYMIVSVSISYGHKRADFSLSVPVMQGMKAIMAVILAFLVFSEGLTRLEFLAILGVIVGIFVQVRFYELFKASHLTTLMILSFTGCIGAMQLMLDVYVIRIVENPFSYYVYLHFIGLPMVVYALVKHRNELLGLLKTKAPLIGLGAMGDTIGYGAVLYVSYGIQVLYVLPVTHLSMVFTTLIGIFYMKENYGWRRITAACIIAASVILMKVASAS